MKNGRIRHIWCRDDGYPEDVGATLYQHYNTWQKVKELIDGGDISSLGAEIGEKHDFDDSWDREKEGKDWTHFYKRDRGLGDRGAIVSRDEDSYTEKAKNSNAEYAYLFDPSDNNWQVLDLDHDEKGWQDLGKVLGKGGIKDKDFEEVHGESSPYPEHGDLEEVHGEGNPYESKKQRGNMLTEKDIQNYATPEEIKILNEDSIPEPPATEEALKRKEEEKAATNALLNVHLNLIDAAALLGSLSMPKEYIDKNIVDLFNNVKSRIAQLTLGQKQEEL